MQQNQEFELLKDVAMSRTVKNPTLALTATIRVRPASELGAEKRIDRGCSSSIKFAGNFYPSQIIECEQEILPGTEGNVKLYMLDSVPVRSGIKEGAAFNLNEGPKLVADGRVISVAEIKSGNQS